MGTLLHIPVDNTADDGLVQEFFMVDVDAGVFGGSSLEVVSCCDGCRDEH